MRVTLELLQDGSIAGRAREHSLKLDRPVERGGKGEGFTSTELLLLALGSCIVGNMGSYANQQGIPMHAARLEVADEVAQAPTRVARVFVEAWLDGEIAEDQMAALIAAGSHCKLHNTLTRGLEVELKVRAESLQGEGSLDADRDLHLGLLEGGNSLRSDQPPPTCAC